MIKIAAYTRITNRSVVLNGEKIFTAKGENSLNLTELYRNRGIDYPKFFKMDNLAKSGFLGAELALRTLGLDTVTPKKGTAVIFMNSSSSLDDDIAYQQTIKSGENYFPSPSVFVYTLANIVTGEVAIRNKIMGESSFYIFEKFSANNMQSIIEQAFTNTSLDMVVCGWVEYLQGEMDVLVMAVQRDVVRGDEFNTLNINKLYDIK
ncbi:MAG: hypothetical protein PHD07_08250 [Bacteroidales bacterium]|nr:hypothetical protein [Bacteroidales bacterium]MDD3200648.1 hypothetical protein [Bacteroidales bacterium]